MLLSAACSVLRDRAMFMRMWFAPPGPYVWPGLSATPAFLMNQRSTICSGVTVWPFLLAAAAFSFAPILSATWLTSIHIRYVPSAFAYVLIIGMLALM